MRTFDDMLSKQLKDDEFRKEYEAIQPEMDVIRAIVDARTSQNMTQKEIAERTGINQADISKLENGTRNPSVNLLKRLADGITEDAEARILQEASESSYRKGGASASINGESISKEAVMNKLYRLEFLVLN